MPKLGNLAAVAVLVVTAWVALQVRNGDDPLAALDLDLSGFGRGSAPGPVGAVADIPANYLALYREAAGTCPDLDWALLAGIGKIETDHGRSPLPGVSSGANSAGAAGPMQFLSATFAGVRAAHPEVGGDVYDPADAIPAAAHYLCDSGLAAGDEYGAIFAYNHADWYVTDVRDQAAAYRAAA